MKKNKRLGNKGFTLIEVLLSIAILALITVPLMRYFAESARYAALTAKKQKATLTAQETIEAIKGQTVLVKWQGAKDETGLVKMHYDLVEDLKKRFKVSDMLTYAQIESMQNPDSNPANANFHFDEGYGKLTYAYEDKSKLESGLGVKVILSTDLGNEAVSSPLVYGIDDTKNVIAAEHTEEDDAIVFFQNANAAVYLQKNGSYISGITPAPTSTPELDVYEGDDPEATSTPDAGESGTPAPGPRIYNDDIVLLTEEQIREKLSRVVHVIVEDNPELGDRYYKVEVYYEYICEDIYGTGTTDSYITPSLINTNLLNLEGLYFMYNRVGTTVDNFEIKWEARQPESFPEFRFVCQNLDIEVEGYDPANYQVHVDMTTKTVWTGTYVPTFRSNLTHLNPVTVNLNGADLEGTALSIKPLTTSANPVRVFDVTVAVYGSKAEMEADTSLGMDAAMIKMKTTKIE